MMTKALASIWATCLVAGFVIVKVLRIGPVIFVVSEKMGWGVHTGDFLALIPLLLAVVATFVFRCSFSACSN